MKKSQIRKALAVFTCVLCTMMLGTLRVSAAETKLVTTVEELTESMMNAQDGDTILVGDITFQPMPMGMMQVPKNLVIKSGKEENAVFANATFALNGTANDAAPLKVHFEGIDFVGDNAENGLDLENPPNISSKLPGIMTTMCAGIFKMNLDVTYSNCSFEGYHYGYGGVFNAIYSSDDNKNELNLKLENCRFAANAGGYGGTLYLIGRNHNISLTAKDCVWEGNAASTGGALWAENAVIDIKNCRFSENQYIEGEIERSAGGAMALYNCDTVLEDCVLEGNSSREGGGLFCEIAPFHTLVMRRCTVNGNKAAEGSSLRIVPAETNYSTEAKAYLYFSSIANHEGPSELLTDGNLTIFGCLFADENSEEEEPSKENGYCLSLPAKTALEKGYTADEKGRIYGKDKSFVIPGEAAAEAANGRFAEYAGQLVPGDFDVSGMIAAPVQTWESSENPTEDTSESGEESGEMAGDSGNKDAAEGSGADHENVAADDNASGGEETGIPVADIPPEVSSNAWVPAAIVGILLFTCMVGGFTVWTAVSERKKTTAGQQAEGGKTVQQPEAASDLPANWIERVCGQPEIQSLLSAREQEVLPLLLEGQSREQIAHKLFISESTVKKHASSIYSKLGVSGKAELIAKMAGK